MVTLVCILICLVFAAVLVWGPALSEKASRLTGSVRFRGVSYTRRELRRLDWNRIAKMEIDTWNEVRSSRALETAAAREWQAARKLREGKALNDAKLAAAKAADNADRKARTKAARNHVEELLQEYCSQGPVSFEVCRAAHGVYGFCVHHFTEGSFNPHTGKVCVRCTRDHQMPSPGDAAPASGPPLAGPPPTASQSVQQLYEAEDDRVNECTVETWAARSHAVAIVGGCECAVCLRAAEVYGSGNGLFMCYSCRHQHWFGNSSHTVAVPCDSGGSVTVTYSLGQPQRPAGRAAAVR